MWSLMSTGWPTCMPARSPPAALVTTTVPQPARTAERTACTTVGEVVALVGVDPAEQREDPPAALGLDRAQHAGVAGHADVREARAARAIGTSAVVVAEAVGRRRPPRAEHDEHVVPLDPRALGDGSGRRRRPAPRDRGRSQTPRTTPAGRGRAPGRGPVWPSTAVAAIEPSRPHTSSGRPR